MPSSLLGEEFYRLPFTPPLSGRLIGPSHMVLPDQFVGGDVQTYYEQGYNYENYQYQPPAED
jgi:hypothetical protein